MYISNLLVFSILVYGSFVESGKVKCNPGSIITWGMSSKGKANILRIHNEYRQKILKGRVPRQPKGKNIAMMKFDNKLAQLAKEVSKTCKMTHIKVQDKRWPFIGQNLYISWSSVNTPGENWTQAANSWFQEHKLYKYPNSATKATGHYLQMIWDTSVSLGCDYIYFFDKNKPKTPYTKLYTCNYGPGGNIKGRAPYKKA